LLIEQFFDAGLGHASYLVADPDAGVAFLVDPDRNIDNYLGVAARLGVLVTDSFETHVHNDYVSGSRALAELRPITVHAGADAALAYPHESHQDGDVANVGDLAIRCVATPGHTPEHVSYLVADLRRSDDPQYLFSGGALLVGQIARVDLLGPERAGELARSAYDTLRDRVLTLADYVAVFPTHGGGSACSAEVAGSRWTTLGFERRHNRVARSATGSFDAFRATIAEGLPVAPAYYPHVRRLNERGAPIASRAPLPFLREIPKDAVRIDPRPPHLFGAGHRPGALNVVGNDSFAVRVGAIVAFGTPTVILSTDAEQAERLRGQLAVVGYDEVRGYTSPDPASGEETLQIEQLDPRTAFARATEQGALLLDVRERSEWDAGHAPSAVHIPYEDLRARAHELPLDRSVVVYCASGIRSSLAASMLESNGRGVANVRGGFTAWRNAKLPVSHEK
jgi:hydroxyacylglutathione hydrolase